MLAGAVHLDALGQLSHLPSSRRCVESDKVKIEILGREVSEKVVRIDDLSVWVKDTGRCVACYRMTPILSVPECQILVDVINGGFASPVDPILLTLDHLLRKYNLAQDSSFSGPVRCEEKSRIGSKFEVEGKTTSFRVFDTYLPPSFAGLVHGYFGRQYRFEIDGVELAVDVAANKTNDLSLSLTTTSSGVKIFHRTEKHFTEEDCVIAALALLEKIANSPEDYFSVGKISRENYSSDDYNQGAIFDGIESVRRIQDEISLLGTWHVHSTTIDAGQKECCLKVQLYLASENDKGRKPLVEVRVALKTRADLTRLSSTIAAEQISGNDTDTCEFTGQQILDVKVHPENYPDLFRSVDNEMLTDFFNRISPSTKALIVRRIVSGFLPIRGAEATRLDERENCLCLLKSSGDSYLYRLGKNGEEYECKIEKGAINCIQLIALITFYQERIHRDNTDDRDASFVFANQTFTERVVLKNSGFKLQEIFKSSIKWFRALGRSLLDAYDG